jgi:hypothetical protein
MALPTEASARIARNTQLILQEETGITHVADPLAGSYYVETLTAQLAEEAWKLIEEVESLGGMTKAVASGMPKLRIEESAARRQSLIDRGTDVIVGVNKYQPETDTPVDILSIDNIAVRDSQIARLQATRAARNEDAAQAALQALEAAARSDGNLLDAAIIAARARATVGEISIAMENVFGRHRAEVKTLAGVYGAGYDGDAGFEAKEDGKAGEGGDGCLKTAALQSGASDDAKEKGTEYLFVNDQISNGLWDREDSDPSKPASENKDDDAADEGGYDKRCEGGRGRWCRRGRPCIEAAMPGIAGVRERDTFLIPMTCLHWDQIYQLR